MEPLGMGLGMVCGLEVEFGHGSMHETQPTDVQMGTSSG